MSTDFKDASVRHFQDASLLFKEQRLANADQLFGYSAECALKAVMVSLGMQTTGAGDPADRGHRVHMPEQWSAFQSFARGRLASRYLEPLSHKNPFADWHVGQRYSKTSSISSEVVQAHRSASVQARTSLETLLLDGVMT